MTSPPPTDTWNDRELPVLREIVRLADETLGGLSSTDEIAENLGMDVDTVRQAARALEGDGLITTRGRMGYPATMAGSPTGEARRRAGTWPTPETALDRMVAALEDLAEHAGDEDTRTRAQKIRDALLAGTGQIGVAVAAAAISGQIPGQ